MPKRFKNYIRVILYEDYTIIIAFEPESSLLSVKWLPTELTQMFEFQNSFHQILKLLDDHSVSNMFIDCSTAVQDLPEEAFQAMSEILIGGLASSKTLKKLARIEMVRPDFEAFTVKTIKAFKEIVNFTFEERSFKIKADALAWLKA